MRKILQWIVILGLAGVLVGLVARNFIARKAVEVGVQGVTGFPLEIGAVRVGLFDGQLDVSGLRLMNPQPDFPEPLFVELPGFHVDYRLGSLLRGSPHINTMKVDLKQVVIVKNAKGESNVQRLKGVAAGSGSGGNAGQSAGSPPSFRLDVVHIHIGTVVYKDYSSGKLVERTTPLNMDATYKDIRSAADITRLALMTMMSRVNLPDVGVRLDDLHQGLSSVQGTAGTAVKSATDAGKGLFDKVKQAVPKK